MPCIDGAIEILVASETGNSFEAADYVHRELIRHHLVAEISDIESAENLHNKNDLVIFILSTCGQGDLPKSMKNFWNFLLQSNLSRVHLANLKFAIFGLGDSSYINFNYAARKLFQRLKQLGSIDLHVLGLGDDQHQLGFFNELETWTEELILSIKENLHFSRDHIPPLPSDFLMPPLYKVRVLGKSSSKADLLTIEEKRVNDQNKEKNSIFYSKISIKQLLTSQTHFQKVNRFSFDVSGMNLFYESGDIIEIYPSNNQENVLKLLKLLKLEGNEILKIELNEQIEKTGIKKRNDKILGDKAYVKVRATDLFRDFLEIESSPKKGFFVIMKHFSNLELEKEKLEEFISKEGREDLYNFCLREHRTFYEVLESFPNSIPPLEYVIEHIPALKARQFSISSVMVFFLRPIFKLINITRSFL